jgi:hypothetical protein
MICEISQWMTMIFNIQALHRPQRHIVEMGSNSSGCGARAFSLHIQSDFSELE